MSTPMLRRALTAALFGAPASHRTSAASPTTPRRRGRPPLVTPEQVLEEIREAARGGQLFRVHIHRPALYARARRLFGTWAGALAAAGVDHRSTVEAARRTSLETRRTRRATPESA